MRISFQKRNPVEHVLSTYLHDNLSDQFTYDTKTYFLHDIVHYCVETELGFKNGFWGLLAQGYKIAQLGKGSVPMRELSRVEKIVGPVQSFYSGHMPEEIFLENMKLADCILPKDFLPEIVNQVGAIMNRWRYMPVGEALNLEFTL